MNLKIKFTAKPNSNVSLQEPYLSEIKGYKMEYDEKSCSGVLTLPQDQRKLFPIFAEKDCIVSVELPEELEEIGKFAFSGCSALKEILIPYKVEKIGELAFHNCTALEKVVSESNCVLEEEMFAGCTALKDIELRSQTSPFSFKGRNHLVFYPDCKVARHFSNGVDVFYKGEKSKEIIKIFDDAGLQSNVKQFYPHDLNDGFIDKFLVIDEEELTEDFKSDFYCNDYAEIAVFVLHNSSEIEALEKAKKIFSPKNAENKFNLSVVMFPKTLFVDSKHEQLEIAFALIRCWGFSHTWHKHLAGNFLGTNFLFLYFYGNEDVNPEIEINEKTDWILSCPHVAPLICASGYEEIQSRNWEKYNEKKECFEKEYCKVLQLDVLDASSNDKIEVETFLIRKV